MAQGFSLSQLVRKRRGMTPLRFQGSARVRLDAVRLLKARLGICSCAVHSARRQAVQPPIEAEVDPLTPANLHGVPWRAIPSPPLRTTLDVRALAWQQHGCDPIRPQTSPSGNQREPEGSKRKVKPVVVLQQP